MRLFLFNVWGTVKIVRASDGERALDEFQKAHRGDRTMLRRAMRELTTGPESLMGGGFREPYVGVIFDQEQPELMG